MSAVLTPALEVVDSLSLLALKIAPNVFDVSSGQHHVSIRDQIVRSQFLIRDLCRAGGSFDRILVVGAGIAGVAAAMAACHAGKKVMVVDTAGAPFSLQAAVHKRYVGPFMYEWPSVASDDQSYPPVHQHLWGAARVGTPAWTAAKPIPASALAEELRTWLAADIASIAACTTSGKTAPRFVHGVIAERVKCYVQCFAAAAATNLERRLMYRSEKPMPTFALHASGFKERDETLALPPPFVPDYVILAAGMGQESVALPHPRDSKWPASGPVFWQDDALDEPAAANARIGIFGGGDGALQDVLRTLTPFRHPTEMLDFLNRDADVKYAIDREMATLSAIEAQSRLANTWTMDSSTFADVDRLCAKVAARLAMRSRVRRRMARCIRAGSGGVEHFVKESHFTKTYLLNRFLVHLLHQCQPRTPLPGRMRYKLFFSAEVAQSGGPRPPLVGYEASIAINGATKNYLFDDIAVRFGIEHGSVPGMQMIKLSYHDNGQRSSLTHVPMAFLASA